MVKCKGTNLKGEPCGLGRMEETEYCNMHFRYIFDERMLLAAPFNNKTITRCMGKAESCTANAVSGTLCQKCWEFLFVKTERRYPDYLELVKSLPRLMHLENLFITKYTHLIQNWDFEKNQLADIRAITFASCREIYWRCRFDHRFFIPLTYMTRNEINCHDCRPDFIKDREKELKDKRESERNRETRKNSVKIGDQSEEYIVELLLGLGVYKNVEKLGHLGGNADIRVTFQNNSYTYLQVKTLSKKKTKDSYESTHGKNSKKYPDNMLMIYVNKERNRFASIFWKDIKENISLTLSFARNNSIYKNIMFKEENIQEFKKRLIDQIPLSTTEIYFSESTKKDLDSMEKVRIFCMEKGLEFKRNITNGDAVDAFINGHRIQVKYRASNGDFVVKVNLKKGSGFIKKKPIARCYDEDDFDFLIILIGNFGDEIKGDENYKGKFCIIPSEELKKQKILRTEEHDGKITMYLYPPNTLIDHWTKPYWNNIDLLKLKKEIK